MHCRFPFAAREEHARTRSGISRSALFPAVQRRESDRAGTRFQQGRQSSAVAVLPDAGSGSCGNFVLAVPGEEKRTFPKGSAPVSSPTGCTHSCPQTPRRSRAGNGLQWGETSFNSRRKPPAPGLMNSPPSPPKFRLRASPARIYWFYSNVF